MVMDADVRQKNRELSQKKKRMRYSTTNAIPHNLKSKKHP